MSINQEEFIKELEELHMKCVEISKAKNADYSSTHDALSNFKVVSTLGIDPRAGLIVRMTDKLARLSNLMLNVPEGKQAVRDESIEDTLLDLSNYAIILAIYNKYEQKTNLQMSGASVRDALKDGYTGLREAGK